MRAKVAILAWDVGHNPLGRAHLLAGVLRRHFDVEIWGAQFARYGTRIWAPLRDSEIPIHTYTGRNFPDHLAVMDDVVGRIDADAVYVSKPRLPSFALGVLAKRARNRPLVLDVDDHELAFFGTDVGLGMDDVRRMRGEADLALPFERTWTRVCETLIARADAITVSNVALRDRFGGALVPHARDERVFDPQCYDREETRRLLGVGPSDRLLLFGGTPRAHKGIGEVLRALERLGDDRYRLLVFGTRELDFLRSDFGALDRWTLALPSQSFRDLPRLVNAADLACVLQDRGHAVARYQFPAKVVDALAMRVPCLVRPVAPLQPLLDQEVLLTLGDDEPLHERIASVFEEHDDAVERARNGRKIFEEAYSYDAVGQVAAQLFVRLLEHTPPLAPELESFADLPRELFPSEPLPARAPGPRRAVPVGTQYDIVMFWKQNDTGIYGRRQDMFLKYLARSDRVRSIVHFDRPTTPDHLIRTYLDAKGPADQRRLVVHQTVRRWLRRFDTDRVHQHTFLHTGRRTTWTRLPPREQFPSYVRAVLRRRGIGTVPTIFWVYPTNDVLPRLLDELDPEIVVADVVDDERTFWGEDDSRYGVFEQNYADVLARSDVVIANCEPVADAMLQFAPEVHVVPNGLELTNEAEGAPRPKELRGISGPIIGYVGNLSQRIDIPLLESLIREHRAWQFVFVGSAHLDRSIMRLDAEPNAHFVGVKPYDETLRFVEHFDVGLIPHEDNEMTRSMNPLKAFVYCSAGVPVVSTPIANLGALADFVTIARGAEGFGAAIERALAARRRRVDPDVLRQHSWEARVERTIELVDRAVDVRPEQ